MSGQASTTLHLRRLGTERSRYLVREAFDAPGRSRTSGGKASGGVIEIGRNAHTSRGDVRTDTGGFIELLPPQDVRSSNEPRWIDEAQVHSTAPVVNVAETYERDQVARVLDRLIEIGREERFERGMESNFGAGLAVLLRKWPGHTIEVLWHRLEALRREIFVVAEICHVFGRLEDARSKGVRFMFLISQLSNESALVRDAAACALALMDDRRAIPYLEQAIAHEKSVDLQEDMRGVVQQLTP